MTSFFTYGGDYKQLLNLLYVTIKEMYDKVHWRSQTFLVPFLIKKNPYCSSSAGQLEQRFVLISEGRKELSIRYCRAHLEY